MRWLALALLTAIAASIAGGLAHAHDAAAWIMENPATAWCCGAGDCEETPEASVKESIQGWTVVATGQFFPRSRAGTSWDEGGRKFGLYEARRPGIWRCMPSYYAPLWRCLFVQPGGT